MRRAGVADRLVAAADVVDDRERQRPARRGSEMQQDAQAVGAQAELADAGLLLDELEGVGSRIRGISKERSDRRGLGGRGSTSSPSPRDVFGAVDADHVAADPAAARPRRARRARLATSSGRRQAAGRVHRLHALDHLLVAGDLAQRRRVGDARAQRVDGDARAARARRRAGARTTRAPTSRPRRRRRRATRCGRRPTSSRRSRAGGREQVRRRTGPASSRRASWP